MKNGKADALSHCHDHVSTPSCPELILPPSMVLDLICWDIEEEIQRAQTIEPPPSACHPSKLFVPPTLHPWVMQWVHKMPISGHLGIHHTTTLISNRFWWPTLTQDVKGSEGYNSILVAIDRFSKVTTGPAGARRSGKAPMSDCNEPFGDRGSRQTATDAHTPGS
ncbi:hypothetical protein QTP86_033089, partial [Hemibagrus guttatus]